MTYNHHDILLTFVAYGLKNFSEVSNMRKVLSVLLLASLLFGIGTNAFAAEKETDEDKAMALIAKTNFKINEEILKAQEKANKLRLDYLSDVRKLEEEGKVNLIEKEYLNGLEANISKEETMEVIEEKLSIIENFLLTEAIEDEDKHLLVEQEVGEITTLLVADENNSLLTIPSQEHYEGKTVEDKYKQLTEKYVAQLDIIIDNLIEKAEKMSAHTIAKVAKVGITAVCELVPVQIGHRLVDVDPISVVGRN
jgi:hypothetical protein